MNKLSALFVKFKQTYRLRNTSMANHANLYTNAGETKDDHLEKFHQKLWMSRDCVISNHS